MILQELPDAARALAAALDVVPDHVVLLSDTGRILHANAAWRRFSTSNGGDGAWAGVDYLAVGGDHDPVSRGVREVVEGRADRFEHEYDCHAPDELRWYRLAACRVDVPGVGAIVTHADVSQGHATAALLGRRAVRDAATGVLRRDVIEDHARQMVDEGRDVTVVRVRLHDAPSYDRDRDLARAAHVLEGLFPAPAALGRTASGLVVVQGGASDEDLLEALRTTYVAFASGFPDLAVTITGERLPARRRPAVPAPDGDRVGAPRP